MNTGFLGPAVATVLTVYGIETSHSQIVEVHQDLPVATVLTVYGIETLSSNLLMLKTLFLLQQYLPFTVLKPKLKLVMYLLISLVATVLTVYGIETFYFEEKCVIIHIGCNSTYRLRY